MGSQSFHLVVIRYSLSCAFGEATIYYQTITPHTASARMVHHSLSCFGLKSPLSCLFIISGPSKWPLPSSWTMSVKALFLYFFNLAIGIAVKATKQNLVNIMGIEWYKTLKSVVWGGFWVKCPPSNLPSLAMSCHELFIMVPHLVIQLSFNRKLSEKAHMSMMVMTNIGA